MATKALPQCQPWCPPGVCQPDKADGSVFHMSRPVNVPTADGDGPLDVSLSRLDLEDVESVTTVDLAIANDRTVGMTPAQAVVFAETLREHALTAAGPDGLDMPVELVRIGEQIHIAGRWETVELLTADGWCCGVPPKPGHRCRVVVGTDAHADDADAAEYARGDTVRVRRAVAA